MKRFLVVLLVAVVCLTACTGKKEYEECVVKPETKDIEMDLNFISLQDSFVNVTSKQKLVELLTRNPEIRDNIFRRAEYPNDSVFIDEIYTRFNNPYIDTLQAETKRVFGDLTELQNQFKEAFTNIKFYYPDFTPPKVKTLISGLDTDLLVTDTLIVVSLDFYLGAGAKYRPKMYDYLLRQFEKQNIVPSCLLIYGISDRFNKTNLEDKTILADMIAYGKSYYFAKHMLPCLPDSTLIGYSAEEIDGARENQDLIWARLVEDQVFYSTSHLIKQKYLADRPKTIEVGEKCPGRIAQWVGWQMVSSYEKSHSEAGLPVIMDIANADKLFKESKYKPEKNH